MTTTEISNKTIHNNTNYEIFSRKILLYGIIYIILHNENIKYIKMRIISFRKLKEFFETPGNEDSEISLRAWNDKVEHAEWTSHADLKRDFPSADYVGNDRYVFNIKGNNYRLVVVVIFNPKW